MVREINISELNAAEWAEGEGYKDQIREGSNTTVIRVEE